MKPLCAKVSETDCGSVKRTERRCASGFLGRHFVLRPREKPANGVERAVVLSAKPSPTAPLRPDRDVPLRVSPSTTPSPRSFQLTQAGRPGQLWPPAPHPQAA